MVVYFKFYIYGCEICGFRFEVLSFRFQNSVFSFHISDFIIGTELGDGSWGN